MSYIHRNNAAGRTEGGQSLIEFAFSFSILMGFVFLFIELCLAFYAHGMISEVGREGTRYAIVRGSTCVNASNASCTAPASDINAYVSGLGFPNLGATINVTTTFPDGDQAPGSRVQVTVQYQFPISLPFLPANSLSMTSSSQMRFIQ